MVAIDLTRRSKAAIIVEHVALPVHVGVVYGVALYIVALVQFFQQGLQVGAEFLLAE